MSMSLDLGSLVFASHELWTTSIELSAQVGLPNTQPATHPVTHSLLLDDIQKHEVWVGRPASLQFFLVLSFSNIQAPPAPVIEQLVQSIKEAPLWEQLGLRASLAISPSIDHGATVGLTLELTRDTCGPSHKVRKLTRRCSLLRDISLEDANVPDGVSSVILTDVQLALVIEHDRTSWLSPPGTQLDHLPAVPVDRHDSFDTINIDSPVHDPAMKAEHPVEDLFDEERCHDFEDGIDSSQDSLLNDLCVDSPCEDDEYSDIDSIFGTDSFLKGPSTSLSPPQNQWSSEQICQLFSTVDSALLLAILPKPKQLSLKDVFLKECYSFMGLAEIAPAVFHPDYLQNIAIRSALVPTIAHALAPVLGFRNSERGLTRDEQSSLLIWRGLLKGPYADLCKVRLKPAIDTRIL